MFECEVCGEEFETKRKRQGHTMGKHVVRSNRKTQPEQPVLSRLDSLKMQGEAEADRLGHELEPWKDEKGWARANCFQCKREVAVAPTPARGATPISGSAVTEDCK